MQWIGLKRYASSQFQYIIQANIFADTDTNIFKSKYHYRNRYFNFAIFGKHVVIVSKYSSQYLAATHKTHSSQYHYSQYQYPVCRYRYIVQKYWLTNISVKHWQWICPVQKQRAKCGGLDRIMEKKKTMSSCHENVNMRNAVMLRNIFIFTKTNPWHRDGGQATVVSQTSCPYVAHKAVQNELDTSCSSLLSYFSELFLFFSGLAWVFLLW